MNLPETIRAYTADLRDRFRGKTWHAGNPGPPLDKLDLAADIIDSLPKAEDGSVIWKGCFVVPRILCDDGYMRIVSRVRHIFDDGSGEIDLLNGDGSIMGDPWDFEASEIMSTHRTRDEAEAAAAKAGENHND